MSTHNRELSSHSLSLIKRVTIEPGKDDEIVDADDFQDIRMELNSTGHNLTSVLMNPRETLLEDLFDEFAVDQSAPLEYQSPFANNNGSSNTSMISASIHSALKKVTPSSLHGSRSTFSSVHSTSSNGSVFNPTSLFTMTNNESEQLDIFILRMNKVFTHYANVHQHHLFSGRNGSQESGHRTHRTRSNSDVQSPPGHSSSPRSARYNHKKLIHEDLRNCYREVPDTFFRPDFSLSSQDMFNSIYGNIDVTDIIERMKMMNRNKSSSGGGGDYGSYDADMHTPEKRKTIEDHLQLNKKKAPAEAVSTKASSRRDRDPSNRILVLQDKLSVYLDLVEMALLRQIYARSPSFFRTLDDIRALQFAVSDTTRHLIHNVREKLQSTNKSISHHAMVIPKMSRRQSNASLLADKLSYMSQVIAARGTIHLLLEAEEYISALELISNTKHVFYSQKLDHIHAMKGIGSQLNDYDNLVCEIMCNKFVSMAIQWEEEVLLDSALNANASSGSSNSSSSSSTTDGSSPVCLSEIYEEFQTKSTTNGTALSGKSNARLTAESNLRQLLQSLVITERVQSALNMYKHRLLEAIRLIVRTCVMEYLTNFDPSVAYGDTELEDSGHSAEHGGPETPFGQRVKEMSPDNFLSCLSMCYEHVILSLQKASVFHSFVESELSQHITIPTVSNGDGEHNRREQNGDTMPTAAETVELEKADAAKQTEQETLRSNMKIVSKQCLNAACDLAQKSIAKLITLRKEANCKLTPVAMKSLWSMSLTFVVSLEDIYVSTAYVLRQCLLAQTTLFLRTIHEDYKKRIVNTLDEERFVQVSVSKERQDEVNRLVSGRSFIQSSDNGTKTQQQTQQAMADKTPSLAAARGQVNNASGSAGAFKSAMKDKKYIAPVVIDGTEFKVIWSVMLLIECIMTYLEIAVHFSPVATDVTTFTDELLNLFNARVKFLILGTGALQSAARLKQITMKHMALTSQSINLVVTLIPHVRAALLAQLHSRQQMFLVKLDETSVAFGNHHNDIVQKFVEIVSDTVESVVPKLRAYNWDSKDEAPCEYFTRLKDTIGQVHNLLVPLLPVYQVEEVFSRIFSMLARKIPTHFEEVAPLEAAGRDRIMDAVSGLVIDAAKLRYLDVTGLSKTLDEWFRKRYRGA